MIDLYSWQTPNGRKVSIMLEETGIDYNVFPINIGKDEQFQPHFLEISPNNRIPAIIDKDNKPKWSPSNTRELTEENIDKFFMNLKEKELIFNTR